MTEILDLLRRTGEHAGGAAPAVGILLRVTVLLLTAVLVARALRRSSAALRHLVWTLSLIGTLLIPLGSWALPAWYWAVLPQRQASAMPATATLPSPASAPVAADSPTAMPVRAPLPPRPSDAPSPPPAAGADRAVVAPSPPPRLIAENSAAAPAPPRGWSWPRLFAAVWAVGSFLGLAWIGVGMAAAWHVARRASPVASSSWRDLVERLIISCGVRRPTEVRESRDVSVPMTWGLSHSVILVPAGSESWSEPVKRSVLLHELGHIRRGDCAMLLLGRLACAVYWFHPLAWLAVRQMRKTSEQAADDLVLASNIAPPDYAEHLVGIAAQMRGFRMFGHVALPMAGPSDLEGRVVAILDPRRNHRSLTRTTGCALMAVTALLLIPCAIVRLGYAQEKQTRLATAANQDGPGVVPAAEHKTAEERAAVTRGTGEAGPAKAGTTSAVTDKPVPIDGVLVDGVVVDQDGKPVTGGAVRALTPGQLQVVAESDTHGRFQFRIDRSRVNGLAVVARNADGTRQAFFDFGWNSEPGKPLPSARLVMRPVRSIDIEVLDHAGKPVPDAVAGAIAAYTGVDRGRTNRQGKLQLHVPADAPLQSLYALKSALGLDYIPFPDAERATTGDLPQPPDMNRPQILKLDGAKTVTIKLIDPFGRPIQGVRVAPWIFQKPDWRNADILNISAEEDFQMKTDAAGTAIFAWIPMWEKGPITFWASDGDRWNVTRIDWDPAQDSAEKTVQLQPNRTVPVRGHVRHADGRPAPEILIQAVQMSRSTDGPQGQTWTDDRGRFEIRVDPDAVYLFAVSDALWTAVPRADVAVRFDTPVENIDFQLLQPATRLHGQLTVGKEAKPWAGETVVLKQNFHGQASRNREISRSATTDAEGKYVFSVGPGKYEISTVDSVPEQELTVADQNELVCDFHAPRKEIGPITVRVVDRGSPPRPVPRARVIGVCTSSFQGDLDATTNDDGWFRAERWLGKLSLYAYSKDKKLAGSAALGPDDAEVTIALQPAGGAKGQVIDQSNGQPVANRAISYAVFYRFDKPADMSTDRLMGSVTTDAQGRFAMAGLVPGLEYQMDMPDDRGRNTDRLGKVTAKSGETVDLGVVKFRRDIAPDELLDLVLGNREPLDKRLKGLADEMKKPGKRVLIMFHTEESRRHLQEIYRNDFYTRFANNGILSTPCDQKRMEDAKSAYGKKWGLDPAIKAWPLFAILDTDGRTLAVKDTHDFVKDGKVDGSLVSEFLEKYALKTPNGEKTPDISIKENRHD